MLNHGPAVLILFSIFIGILRNRRDYSLLRLEINRQFDEVNRRLGLIEGDQKQFFTVTGMLEGRVEQLSRK